MSDLFDSIPRGSGFGVFLAGVGFTAMAMMLTAPAGLNVPLWVALAAAGCFVFAGASFIARAFGWPRLANMLALGVVWGLAVPGAWIALGSDGSGCAVSAAGFGAAANAGAGGFACRLAFGAGSAIILLCALTMTWMVMRTRRIPEAQARRA